MEARPKQDQCCAACNRMEEQLSAARAELESRVQERTEELLGAIEQLQVEILQRELAEERLLATQEQLRALSARVISIQEEERARIAREVHDELGQALTALKLDLAWLNRSSLRSGGNTERRQKVTQMIRHVDATIKTVRRIATELRPGVLDDLGLVAAIEWQVQEFERRTLIGCGLSIDPDDMAVPPALATTIFRLLQEALTNVARHAAASQVLVTLIQRDGRLILQVRDNGRGIASGTVSDPDSLGLAGMRERVLPWGGRIEFRGAPAAGTTITVTFPLPPGNGAAP